MNEDLDNLFKEIKNKADPTIIGLQLELQLSNKVSNSHSCPKNGVSNFMRVSDKPLYYPGLTGRIWYRTDGSDYSSFSDPVSGLVHTGTGGYGAYSGKWTDLYKMYALVNKEKELYYCSYDCKVFGDDFPEILALLAKQIMCKESLHKRKYKYYWLDSKTKEKDMQIEHEYNKKLNRRYLK